jgi:hypothetical protein
LAAWATAIVLMLAGAADASASSGATRQGHLKLMAERHIDRRLVELTFTTPALDDPTHVRVLLPSGYERSHRRYPVLYLLN